MRMVSWKKILLIVGLIFLVVFGIKGVIFWHRASTAFHNAKQVMARDFAKSVSQLLPGDHMHAGHIELLRELVRATEDMKTSFFGVVLSAGVGWQAIEDGRITQQEHQAIDSTIKMLRKSDGKVGFLETVTFLRNHPDVYQVIEELARKNENQRSR